MTPERPGEERAAPRFRMAVLSPDSVPFSAACERNKGPILEVLRTWLPSPARVLEIGSGTGQHGVHFCAELAGLRWQLSERPPCLEDLRLSLEQLGLAMPAPGSELLPPQPLDVDEPSAWPAQRFQAVFTANTLHIMAADSIPNLLSGSAGVLDPRGLLLIYGPFQDGGRHTAASNAAFDAHLRALDPAMGVRDAEQLTVMAEQRGLRLAHDQAMPANNRLLVFERRQEAGDPWLPQAVPANGIDQPD
jgi:SAM-dependent methyltransferase